MPFVALDSHIIGAISSANLLMTLAFAVAGVVGIIVVLRALCSEHLV